jgi:hypothetical protein
MSKSHSKFEDGAVIYLYNCFWPCLSSHSWVEVPQKSRPYFIVSYGTPPTWRARFPFLYPPGTGLPSYTPGHWIYLLLDPIVYVSEISKTKNKLHGLSPRANYTDRSTATCRRSDCQLLRIKGATWSAWHPYCRILGFLDRSRYFSIK